MLLVLIVPCVHATGRSVKLATAVAGQVLGDGKEHGFGLDKSSPTSIFSDSSLRTEVLSGKQITHSRAGSASRRGHNCWNITRAAIALSTPSRCQPLKRPRARAPIADTSLEPANTSGIRVFGRSKGPDRASSIDHRWSFVRQFGHSWPRFATHPRRIGSTKDAVGATRALGKVSPRTFARFTGSAEEAKNANDISGYSGDCAPAGQRQPKCKAAK